MIEIFSENNVFEILLDELDKRRDEDLVEWVDDFIHSEKIKSILSSSNDFIEEEFKDEKFMIDLRDKDKVVKIQIY